MRVQASLPLQYVVAEPSTTVIYKVPEVKSFVCQ